MNQPSKSPIHSLSADVANLREELRRLFADSRGSTASDSKTRELEMGAPSIIVRGNGK